MKLLNLSANHQTKCFVIKFKTCTIMLDCCLDYSPLFNYLPLTTDKKTNTLLGSNISGKEETVGLYEIKKVQGRAFVDSNPEFNPPEMDFINFSRIDIILISNFESIDALPYITEHSGFKGQVYATDPTKEFGRLLMEDLVENCKRYPKDVQSSMWKDASNRRTLPADLQRWENNYLSWRSIYSKEDIYKSLQNIKSITYNEIYEIFGALKITAYPSGYSIGSCNWTIQSDFEKIAYMSSSSKVTPTHPQLINEKPMCNADALLFAGMTQSHGTDVNQNMNSFIDSLKLTMDRGGNTLVPTQPCGVVLDLIVRLSVSPVIDNNRDFTIYFISPTAKGCLSFSQIYAEWLHEDKHNNAYKPQPPFVHNELIDIGKLKVKASVKEITIGKGGKTEDFKQPCLVFASHPSLRMGDAVHFMNMWSKNSNNSIIFINPSFPHVEALAPFQPVHARVYNLPMDKRLDANTSTIMLDKLAPKRVFAPSHYCRPPLKQPHRTDWKLNTAVTPVELNSVVKLNLNRSHEKVFLQPELASSLVPKMTPSGVYLTSLTAQLSTMDNKHTLSVPENSSKNNQISLNKLLCCGKIELDDLFQSLQEDQYFGEPDLDRENKIISTNLFSLQTSEEDTKITFHCQDEPTRNIITEKIFAFCSN